MEHRPVTDLVQALQRAKGDSTHPCGKAMFLIGAGCSKSAGIPLAREIVFRCVEDLAKSYSNGRYVPENPEEALEWLKAQGKIPNDLDTCDLYGHLFGTHYQDPTEQQRIISDAIGKGDGKINWAHLCLGELVRQHYIHTVLTTNFDQLVLEGIIRTGILPVVADGVESLTRVSSKPVYPQVVHLHGSMHTYRPLNSTSAVRDTEQDLRVKGALYSLVQHSSLIVIIGYAGGEEGIMSLLVQAARRLPDKVIYWVQHGTNLHDLSEKTKELLSCTENKFLITGQTADGIFAELMKGLALGTPKWMNDPIASLREHADRIAPSDNRDIHGQIVHYRKRLLGYRDAESAHEKALREIRQLRLQGHHKRALSRAEEHFDFEKSTDPEILFMCGDSAYELACSDASTDWLSISVESYQEALKLIQKDNDRLLWAMSQSKLGNALRLLGTRERRRDTLSAAVGAYQKSLEVYSFHDTPQAWAGVQDDMGIAFFTLSREKNNDIDLLEQALAAHQNALNVYANTDLPEDWARVQNHLGQVFRKLGKKKQDWALLKQAVVAHEKALEVYDRDHSPLAWAITQDHLGLALHRFGYQSREVLEQAAGAYEKALKVYAREQLQDTPQWAMTQSGLGNVLRELGDLTNEEEWFVKAESAYSEALKVHSNPGMAAYDVLKGNLKRVKDSVAKLAIDNGKHGK